MQFYFDVLDINFGGNLSFFITFAQSFVHLCCFLDRVAIVMSEQLGIIEFRKPQTQCSGHIAFDAKPLHFPWSY